MAEGGRGEESGGARGGCVIDSASSRLGEADGTTGLRTISYHLGESVSSRGLHSTDPVAELNRSATSSAGGCPSFRDASESVPVEDVPRENGQWEEGSTARGLGPARESAEMRHAGFRGICDFGCKEAIPIFDGKLQFPQYRKEAIMYSWNSGFEAVFARAHAFPDVNIGDTKVSTATLETEFRHDVVRMHLHAWQFLSTSLELGQIGTSCFE